MKKLLRRTILSAVLVLGILVGLLGVHAILAEPTVVEIPDLTTAAENISADGYQWDHESKTLTLSGVNATGIVVPAGTKIVITDGTKNVINAGETNGIVSDGYLEISGKGKLTVTGANGIKASSVSITDTEIDFSATSCGIQVYNSEDSAAVSMKNVKGSVEGAYAGIYVAGAKSQSEAKVELDSCELTATSTATSGNNRARKSGIVVYVSEAKLVEGSITIKNSTVTATGYDTGICINNYIGDAVAENAASSRINIENSTVKAYGVSGTWAGIFASVLGQHADSDSMITIKNSSVYAESPNTGILSSSQKGESKIVLSESVLGVSGKTAISMIEPTSQAQVAEIKDGSTYIQMTPEAVCNGELTVFDGKTIIATTGEITYDPENNYYKIPQGAAVTEKYTDGEEKEYTFNKQNGGVGGFDYAKDEIWGYDVEFKWESGDIIIYTPEELIEFATYTQDGTLGDCTGRTVKLGADIDMSDYDWYYRNAEGTVVTDHRIPKFAGKFDGCGFAIKNMKYRDEYKEAKDATPLSFIINCIGSAENLTLDKITVDTVAPAYFGALVDEYAWFKSGSTRYIDSCTVKNIVINSEADLVFGGMCRKVIDGTKVSDCHVDGLTINAKGALNGPNSGRCGGFIATGGEKTTFENCSVSGLIINAESTGGHIGGFIGGASMTSTFNECSVNGFKLSAVEKFSAVGGFVGYTAGSAWGNDGIFFNECTVSGLDVKTENKISAAGGFIGYLYGKGTAIDNGAHHFTDCDTKGSIAGEGNIGGFAGWLYGRSGGCAANFTNCNAAVNVYSEESAVGAFAGNFVPYDTNTIIVSYNNCTASGDVFGKEAIGSFMDGNEQTVDGIIGGTYNFDPENVNSETGEVNNVAPGYRALDNGDGTWTVFADQGKEVVKVYFHRFNDETGEYENWRTVEVFKDVDFFESAFDNALNFSHPKYRFANGIGELDEEADDMTEYPFLFWTDVPYGTTLALDNEIVVEGDMNVYANYQFEEIDDEPLPEDPTPDNPTPDDPTPDKPNPDPDPVDPPQTGDAAVFFVLIAVAALAVGFALVGKRRLA